MSFSPLRRLPALFAASLLLAPACAPVTETERLAAADPSADFVQILDTLAEAWNQGDSHRAADCFTEDAIYSEPPDRQLYEGRDALFEFFGGDDGRAGAMSMTWRHRAYDPTTGIGFGEFSFTYGSTVHGVVVVRLREGKIANWREYWYESELPWEEFVAANPF